MCRNLLVCACLLLVSFAAPAAISPEILKSWTVVVASDAPPVEQYAAEEFCALFKEAAGVSLPLSHHLAMAHHVILIGAEATGRPAGRYGEEELSLQIKKDCILIAGGRPRGVLYGVYEFFERYFGAEFLTYDHTYFPPLDTLKDLPLEKYRFNPAFSFRWSYYKENVDHPEFATRLRINTITDEEKLGGKTPQNLIGHSYYKWISPEKYASSHPEYFALVDGVRKTTGAGGGPQPCVSNPEVVDIITQGVLDELKQHPGLRNITVSQNDNGAYCQCPECSAINDREDSPMGANLTLVNAVAERVEKVYPDVKIGTLAYWYTRKPPKALTPRKNVQIQLCSIECCALHPINDPSCPVNQAFCKDLDGWRALSKEIWIWNYNTNFSFYDLPFPNLKSIGPNVKLFLDSHAKGVFMQADGNGNSGEFCDLRNYVMSKCLWHPGADSWALAERFCRLHYGAAADEILAYIRRMHEVSETQGFHPDCGPPPERLGFTAATSREFAGFFERALVKAENETIRERVEKASIPVYKAQLLTMDTSWRYESGRINRVLAPEYATIREQYAALCQKYTMTMHNEGTTLADFLKQNQEEESVPAVPIENSVWRILVTPEHNGAVVGLFHKPSGRELLRALQSNNITKGILETYIQAGPYQRTKYMNCAVESTENRVILTKNLPEGTVEVRTITLPEDHPELVEVGFTLTQGTNGEQAFRFTSQAGFHPGTHATTADVLSVYVKDNGWKLVNRDWLIDDGPDSELMDHAQEGGFAFFNHAEKFGVELDATPGEVGKFYMFWHPDRPQLNMDVRTPTVTLSPGKSLSLNYSLRYLAEAPR